MEPLHEPLYLLSCHAPGFSPSRATDMFSF